VPKLTLVPTQSSIQWVPGALNQHPKKKGKKPGHEGSLLSSAKVKKKCSKTSHLLILHSMYTNNFNLTIYCENVLLVLGKQIHVCCNCIKKNITTHVAH